MLLFFNAGCVPISKESDVKRDVVVGGSYDQVVLLE